MAGSKLAFIPASKWSWHLEGEEVPFQGGVGRYGVEGFGSAECWDSIF